MISRQALIVVLLVAVYHAPVVAASQLPMKMDYAEGVIMKSANAKRVEESDNVVAKEKLKEARDKFQKAREAQDNGEFKLAGKLTNEALRLVTSAAQMVPNVVDKLSQNKKRYQELLKEINVYQSWKKDYSDSERGEQEAKDMEMVKVQLENAESLTKQNNYAEANELLQNVLGIVVTYANSSLKSRTFSYDLNFETAIDEYKYEILRNDDYLRLIPIAIAQKMPSAGIKSLMGRFSKKSEQFRDDAEDLYENKKFEEAVAKMKESTNQLITSLKMAGVR